MAHSFEKDYWEEHWVQADDPASAVANESTANPYLLRETATLRPGTALDAGCGTGAEAIWLAGQGWRVTAADISANALQRAGAAGAAVGSAVTWVEADLTTWVPNDRFDLVVTSYAHPAVPQLAFYDRISDWVAPGGTLLIIGHLHHHDAADGEANGHDHQHDDHPPAEATVTRADITARLDPAVWRIDTAEEHSRQLDGEEGRVLTLHDVVVRAGRLA
ncbi:class I SAM-dependent methyltransferase [Cryobacterium arcticum]|uniref:SAM-dependent methyltransferase n=1 Tax=Cryobacterium arcticum TaxID=670052 RepID=A0A317ZWB7_9MICO|nr:class I SAM-dependent methyltransferase [Cryobacterium arcticum]PXA71653.1 SAM-dependent methyltransferase [Cryobacterium arcticum]